MKNNRLAGYPGFLIVVEGIDGSGKTTLTRTIHQNLLQKGFDAVLISEPTGGYYGKLIRDNARKGFRFPPEKERELFVKDRIQNVQNNILPALQQGKIVLMDRYYISTMAYQGARGLDPSLIKKENESFAPVPDLLLILDLPAAEGLKRITEKRKQQTDDFEKETYLETVRECFLKTNLPNTHILDASKQEHDIYNKAMNVILTALKRKFHDSD